MRCGTAQPAGTAGGKNLSLNTFGSIHASAKHAMQIQRFLGPESRGHATLDTQGDRIVGTFRSPFNAPVVTRFRQRIGDTCVKRWIIGTMIRIVSWNIKQQDAAWRELADSDSFDVALLQEARRPPDDVLDKIEVEMPTDWNTGGTLRRLWRAVVARVSDRVTKRPITGLPIGDCPSRGFAISRSGTLAVAEINLRGSSESILVASMYGAWEKLHPSTGSSQEYADASVHRIISDLSVLIGQRRGHRMIVAGDLNILRGYGENGDAYWGARYATVFDRMEAIGLPCIGPSLPDGGFPPKVRPPELPKDSTTVPTYRARMSDPTSATRQLDFVFASHDLVPRIRTRALNAAGNWGLILATLVLIRLRTCNSDSSRPK